MSTEVEEQEGLQMSFLDHLDELRRRLVNSVAAIFIAFILCWLVSDKIFNFLSIPINAQIRKMRIAAQSINGTPDLNQLKENEVAQYTFVQESSVGQVKIPLGTTIEVKKVVTDGQADLVTAKAWTVGKNVVPVGSSIGKIQSDNGSALSYDDTNGLVITKVGGAFTLYMTIALYTGIGLAIPFLLYQVWAFIAPGLYKHEKHYAVPVISMSAIFFIAGVTFAYKIAFPRACEYLLGLQQSGKFQTLINAEDYFDLIIMIMLGLGVVFQIPSLSFLLGRIGLLTAGAMLKTWRYAIVVILIIAAVLTPTPDPYNLMIFATPMFALYFLSIGIVWIFGKPRQTDEEYDSASS